MRGSMAKNPLPFRQKGPLPLREALRALPPLAERLGMRVYLVGGVVRDLLLGLPNFDLDIVVEGDAMRLARALASSLSCGVLAHPRFGTASLTLEGGYKVDLATARTESYPGPAALPRVAPGTLAQDLGRRDFTINAMAVVLNGPGAGELIDPFGGRRDLRAGRVRALHSRSYRDDPTRAFRAVRFAVRFGYKITPADREMIRKAVGRGLFGRLSGARLAAELDLLLKEEKPFLCVRRLARLGLLRTIHPSLRAGSSVEELFARAGRALRWFSREGRLPTPDAASLYRMALLCGLSPEELEAAGERLGLMGRALSGLKGSVQGARRAAEALSRRGTLRPSRLYRLLENLSPEAQALALALSPERKGRRYLMDYWSKVRDIAPSVTGDDLLGLGLEPGPLYRKLLTELREALMDEEVKRGRREELRFIRMRLKKLTKA